MSTKGRLRTAFEKELRLKPEQCELNRYGEYENKLTHALWAAFKAGNAFTHRRGTFVVAEIHADAPYFNPAPRTYDFAEQARDAQRLLATRTQTICAVFQRISCFDPSKAA